MKNRKKYCIGGLITFCCLFATGFATYTDFLQTIQETDIDIEQLQQQPSMSRYDIARLLNTIECKDCIHAPQDMIEQYTQQWWSNFVALPDKDFRDIAYQGAEYKDESYYYCVAYAGNQEYMRGFPEATSPICGGQFCGQNNVTTAELIQVLINIASNYIYDDFSINRKQAKIRLEELPAGSYQDRTLSPDQKEIIRQKANECNNTCTLQSPQELKTYLNYCMFNLQTCNMRAFDSIQQGARPVAELNVLENVEILGKEELGEIDIHELPSAEKVLRILYRVFGIVDCAFDNDYDCDGFENKHDNCPNTYNPSQNDFDQDNKGDVCDDDIDNDGIPNPIGIIDESNNINIHKAKSYTGDRDSCYFDPTNTVCNNIPRYVGLAISINQNSNTSPGEIQGQGFTNGDPNSIKRQTSDGKNYQGNQIQHTFTTPGYHTLFAKIVGPNNTAKAQAMIDIPYPHTGMYIGIQSTQTQDGQTTIFANTNTGNTVIRTHQNSSIQRSSDQPLIINALPPNQTHIINASIYQNDDLQAVASTSIHTTQQETIRTQISTDQINTTTNEPITLSIIYNGFTQNDILENNRTINGQSTNTNQLSINYTPETIGTKIIENQITLDSGITLISRTTIQVNKPKQTNTILSSIVPQFIETFTNTPFETQFINQGINTEKKITQIIQNNNNIDVTIDTLMPNNTQTTSWKRHGPKNIKQTVFSQQCKPLISQATIVSKSQNNCKELLQTTGMGNFGCDMDQDQIPDMCDDDIDGDGIQNIIGIITQEYENCTIDQNNINWGFVQNNENSFVGFNNLSCQLDNCPFTTNTDQSDVDLNGQGDSCQNMIEVLLQGQTIATLSGQTLPNSQTGTAIQEKDTDNDNIPDRDDNCPTVPEEYNGIFDNDGCPELNENPCKQSDATIPPLPEEDYCQYHYPEKCTCTGLTPKQCCDEYGQDCDGQDDPGEDDNQCAPPYGQECKCFGLTQQECCQAHGFDCEEPDYCGYPYPVECKCVGLTQSECCEVYGLDCDDDSHDDEDESGCVYPYGKECMCSGLTQDQCCQEYGLDCGEEDYCSFPYPTDCTCVGLTQQECCKLHGQDCPIDYCQYPYPDNCKCNGLTQQECCEQHGQDCDGQEDDPEEDDNNCNSLPYGPECICEGLSQQQCCQEYGFNCGDEDYCQYPYPDNCKCNGLTQQECCEQHRQDCDGQEDDPGENDNNCDSYPYGAECICEGLSQQQCCQQHNFNCSIDDEDGEDIPLCEEPYSPECLCHELNQEECCQQHGLDCDDDSNEDDYCGYPYPSNCTCTGLTQQKCCEEYGQDCNGDSDDQDDESQCEFPYAPECVCFGLSQSECCAQHDQDCDDQGDSDDNCEYPYDTQCQCFGLTQQECCTQYDQDCDDQQSPEIPQEEMDEPDDYITPITCDSCPCQYADYLNNIQKGNLLRAFLRDVSQQYEYNRSDSYSYSP